MHHTHILFDLDGTLTDPAEGITRSVSYALSKFGIAVDDLTCLHPFIGPPLKQSFINFYGFSDADADSAIVFYREYFSDRGIFENRPYPGIDRLLQRLSEADKTLAVATSKPTVFAERILEHFDLARFFSCVVGSNLDGTRVDKSDVIAHVLKTCVFPSESTVMVGDREHDIIGARKNGLLSVGVLYGYGSADELKCAGAAYTVNTVDELSRLLLG